MRGAAHYIETTPTAGTMVAYSGDSAWGYSLGVGYTMRRDGRVQPPTAFLARPDGAIEPGGCGPDLACLDTVARVWVLTHVVGDDPLGGIAPSAAVHLRAHFTVEQLVPLDNLLVSLWVRTTAG
jgi:hypothetical protein